MIQEQNLKRHIETLCDIGVRLAGSENERRAAQYVVDVCRENGIAATLEDFPVRQRCVEEERLQVFVDGEWREFPCSLFNASASTDGRELEAEIAWFDSHTDYQRGDLGYLRGKAVVHLGCHIESADCYRALMQAKPAFLLFIDTRHPSHIPLADGLFPAYVRKYGARPTVNVAFFDAWEWKKKAASKARLFIKGEFRESLSENMVAELPGSAPELGCVYVGGHHDTQAGTVGADDNATGTAAVIELARNLAERPHQRTIRLISFGAEEQLSMGSSVYVRRHRREVESKGVFMANFDTFGSLLGWNCLQSVGTSVQTETIRKLFRLEKLELSIETEISPYVDNFSFNAVGVPSFWVYRKNCEAGNFYHHRSDATPERLDYGICASIVRAGAEVIRYFANTPDLSQYRPLSDAQKLKIAEYWETVYGGWG